MVEDAAQGLGSTYRGTPLGRLGGLAATSFHETKNVISGEGGALLVNDPSLVERAEMRGMIVQPTGAEKELGQLATGGLSPIEKVLALQRIPLFSRASAEEMRAVADLALWHAFEADNSDAFAGMYQFWVRKRG